MNVIFIFFDKLISCKLSNTIKNKYVNKYLK